MKHFQIIFDNINLEDLQVVLKVMGFHSITTVATHLDMRTATDSTAVKRVENVPGVEAFYPHDAAPADFQYG